MGEQGNMQKTEQWNNDAEYDQWLHECINQAVAEADSPDAVWIDHETIKQKMQVKREQLQKQIEQNNNN